jgi:hypothetical protein
MAAAVRAMRRAISPRLAIRSVLIGLTSVAVLELAGWVDMERGAWRRRGEDAVMPPIGARRRCEVRLRERIVDRLLLDMRDRLNGSYDDFRMDRGIRRGIWI